MTHPTQTQAERLADQLADHIKTSSGFDATIAPHLTAVFIVDELRRLSAIEQRHTEMLANPCPEWDNKAYMAAIANLRAENEQLKSLVGHLALPVGHELVPTREVATLRERVAQLEAERVPMTPEATA